MPYPEHEIVATYKAILDAVHGKNARMSIDALIIALAKAFVLSGGRDKAVLIARVTALLNAQIDIELEWKRKFG